MKEKTRTTTYKERIWGKKKRQKRDQKTRGLTHDWSRLCGTTWHKTAHNNKPTPETKKKIKTKGHSYRVQTGNSQKQVSGRYQIEKTKMGDGTPSHRRLGGVRTRKGFFGQRNTKRGSERTHFLGIRRCQQMG